MSPLTTYWILKTSSPAAGAAVVDFSKRQRIGRTGPLVLPERLVGLLTRLDGVTLSLELLDELEEAIDAMAAGA